jgi:hypothetical protein
MADRAEATSGMTGVVSMAAPERDALCCTGGGSGDAGLSDIVGGS